MNKFKKILSTVLAIGLVASTIVLPVSVQADDYIVNETFDGEVIENLFGTTEAAENEIVAGNILDFKADGTGDKIPVGLDADDKIMKVTGNNAYFNQNGLVGTAGWGADSTYTHATYEMDVWFYNGWNKLGMSPGGKDRYGFMFGGSESSAKTSFYIVKGDSKQTDLKTVGRRQWYHVGVEYDYTVSPAVMKVYLDNELLATQELAGERTSVPTDMRLYSSTSQGHNFINNFKFYEGAYRPGALTTTKIQNYDFSDASQCEAFTPNSTYGTSSVVAGFAGKAASDQVANVWGSGSGHNITSTYTYPWDVITYETEVFGQSGKGAMLYNATNDGGARYGLKLQDGKLQVATCNGWTYEDVEGYTDVDMNSWHKMAVEINGIDGMYYLYFDGVKVAEKSAPDTIGAARISDARFSGQAYLDNFKVYNRPYETETRVSAASTAKVTVSGSTLTAPEGTTLDELKAVVADSDAITFYSDDAQTTVTNDVASAKYMAVKLGDLYKSYEVELQSPYGTKLVWYDFTDAANATAIGATQADGLMGKDASDKVAYASASTGRKYLNGGNTVDITSGVVTYEASIYVPAGSTSIMHLFNGGGNNTRLGMKIQANGTVTIGETVSGAGVWDGLNDTATTYGVAENTWNKLAMEMNANTDTVKFYLNDALVNTVAFTADLTAAGTQFAFETTNTYIDNMRMYTAPYVAGEPIAAVAGATDGVINVTEGTTVAQVKAMVTDGTPEVYTDATLATVASTVADDSVLLIKKGELYQVYALEVAGLYDDSLILVDFDDQATTNEGTGSDFNPVANWVYSNAGAYADESFVAGVGGKAANDYAVSVTVPQNDETDNIRIQTGWGNASTSATGTVYTLEADVYTEYGSQSNGIMMKMRNAGGSNIQPTVNAPHVANRWYKLALTIDTEAGTIQGYVNGVPTEANITELGEYTIFSNQVNVNFPESGNADVTSYADNMRWYAGEYRGGTAPAMAASVTMAANSTVADVIAETGADFVVDANGNKVTSTAAAVATGYQAVKVDGEMFGYTAIEVEVAVTDVAFTPLAVGDVYVRDGVEYVFVAITTGTIADISLYDTFRVTDGTVVKEMALSELMGTTLTGAAEIGVLVMNVPYANINNAAAKLVLAD